MSLLIETLQNSAMSVANTLELFGLAAKRERQQELAGPSFANLQKSKTLNQHLSGFISALLFKHNVVIFILFMSKACSYPK